MPSISFMKPVLVGGVGLALSACASLPSMPSMPGTGKPDPATLDTVSGDYLQGLFAASRQDYTDASDAFQRAAVGTSLMSVENSAFRYALAAGDMKGAERHARRILEAASGPPEEGDQKIDPIDTDLPRLTLAVLALDRGELTQARAYLAEPFGAPLGQTVAHLVEAWVVFDQQGVEGAVIHLGSGDKDIFRGFSPLQMALMLDIAGRADAAGPAYQQSLQGDGANLAIVAYAFFLEKHGDREQALEFVHKLAAERGYIRRVGRMALVRLNDPLPGESQEFIRVAKKSKNALAVDGRSGAATALTTIAWAAYDQAMQQQEAAERAGFNSLVVSLDIPLTLAQLASVLDDNVGAADYLVGSIAGAYLNHEMAVTATRKIKPTSWIYNYAVIDRARALGALDREEEAMRLIRGYLKQDALAPDVSLTLAEMYAAKDNYPAAIDQAAKAIDMASQTSTEETREENLWRYYFARGAITAESGDWGAAEKDLTYALELAPDEPLVLNFLGYSYVERGERVDEAFAMIEKALKARPSSGAITDSLGWAHYQRGEYAKAVEYLERAVALEPENDTITDHLGDAYWQAGRKIEAKYEWRRVLDMKVLDDEIKARAEKKLAGEPPAPGALLSAAAKASDPSP